ncbi:uncharacterized protein CELE_M70.1 [Caenorhabditis elegans]|uniref:Domain of unknown function WSN domain-containing protein n=1 Tax=Caenorhabditis elegans TaxID=6239 RepID=O45187_CAEEL|nr:protein of unknown function WSN domain-containing protein [Caenorhabditis elegans]CCD66973.1 Domain of unknown function WSN domain-containing protein [Caenorhabditis elegans]|eukprot:NP_500182.1 Uncharacterized protein CELE_M70.1 [Caenorhabditis elegans]
MMKSLWLTLGALVILFSSTSSRPTSQGSKIVGGPHENIRDSTPRDKLIAHPDRQKRAENYSPPQFKPNKFLHRLKRAENDYAYSLLMKRIPMLARVVSAISLYNGLVDNSIPSDEAITDLLNIGGVKLKDLETFDKTKVDDVIAKWEEASEKISGAGSVDLHKAIVDAQTVRTMWKNVGDLNSIPDKEAFKVFEKIEKLDLKIFEIFAVSETLKLLDSRASIATAKKSLEAIIKSVRSAIDATNGGLDTLSKLAPFHSAVKVFSFYENSAFKDIIISKTSDVNSMDADIENIKKLPVTTIFKMMSTVASRSTNIFGKYTAGFSNGVQDLQKIEVDLKDEWIQKTMNRTVDGLKNFKELGTTAAVLDGKLKGVGTMKHSASEAARLEKLIENSRNDQISAKKVIDSIILCKYFSVGSHVKSVVTASQNSQLLERTLNAVKKISELIATSKLGNSLDSIPVETLKTFTRQLKSSVALIKNRETVALLATKLKSESDLIVEFKENGIVKPVIGVFDCLKNKKDDFGPISNVLEVALKLRELKSDQQFFKNLETASSGIAGSSSSIKPVRDALSNIKKNKNTGEVGMLKDLQKYSLPLGSVATAIVNSGKVLEKKAALYSIIEDGDTVEEGLISVSSEALNLAVGSKYGDFHALQHSLVLLLGKLESWRSSIKKPANDTLVALTAMFKGLSQLPSVDIQADLKILAIDELSQKLKDDSQQQKLDELKSSLQSVEPLDLQFSKFNGPLNDISTTLNGLALVFSNANKDTLSGKTAGDNGDSSNSNMIIIIEVSILIPLLILIIVVLILWSRKLLCFKKKDTKPSAPKPKPDVPVNPTPQTAKVPVAPAPPAKDEKPKDVNVKKAETEKPKTEVTPKPAHKSAASKVDATNTKTEDQSSAQNCISQSMTHTETTGTRNDEDQEDDTMRGVKSFRDKK